MAYTPTVSSYGKYIDLQKHTGTAPTNSGSLYFSGSDASPLFYTNVGMEVDGAFTAGAATFTTCDASTDFTIDGLVLSADTITNDAALTVVSTGLTLNASLDIALSADGGNVTMDDGTTTVFDFNTDDPELKIMDDAQVANYLSMAVGANGATTIQTVDADAAAANLQITADGTAELAGTTVTLDSAGDIVLSADGDNITMDDGTTTIFDFDVADPSFKIMDDAQVANYCSLAVGANGATTLTTVDADAAAANLIITADGTVDIDSAGAMTLDSGAGILLEPAAGSVITLDGVITIDAGVVAGATSVTSTAFVGDLTGDVTGTSSKATVSDSTANTNFPVVFNNESDGLLDDTGALHYNPSTGLLTAPVLTVAGNLTVNGTTTTVDSTTINISSSFTFEGPADAHETIFSCATPAADTTLNLPTLSAGTYYIPALAGAATDASAAVTAAEFALLDGGSSVAAITVADGDGVFLNDGGTMKHVTVQSLAAYYDDEITAMPNLVTTAATTVGALNAGSITSGFGAIDNGTSNITTGGKMLIDVDGSAIDAAGALTLGASADAAIYFDGTDLCLDAPASAGHSIRVAGTEVAIWEASGLSLAAGDAYSIDDTSVLNATTLGSAVVASSLTSVGTLGGGAISSGFGAIDNGTSNITTGGILKLDVDGSAINAAGALTMGAGNDASVYFDGTDLTLDGPSGAGVAFKVAGTEVGVWDASGISIASGDAYLINDTSVLNATTLGSAVVASSLTSVGTLTALTAGADGTGADATFRAVASSQYMFWDASGNSNKGALGFGKAPENGYIIDCKESDGDIRADAFVTYSDQRLKTNINRIENPMATLQKLNGVSYDMKGSGRHDIGFIAQDVNKVVPEVVRTSGDTMGIDYSRLTALLTEAVKAQQVEINALKARLDK